MQRHHEVEMMAALDELYLRGATSIRWEQLYLWFDADRLSKNAYRQIAAKWEELTVEAYGLKEAPAISVFPMSVWLTLTRAPIGESKEKWVALSDWM
jgi:hypothetical protein